jgi:amidase
MPAHFCGIFGLKPTQHRVATTGHIPPPPGVPSPDRLLGTMGPLTRSVEDLSLLMRVISGPDGFDWDVPPVPWQDAPRPDVRRMRIAYKSSFPGVPTSKAVRDAVDKLVHDLERAGVVVEERNPGFSVDELNATWTEFFRFFGSVLADLSVPGLPVKPPDGPPPKPATFVHLLAQRDALIQKLEELLREFDAYLTPASITTAFEHSAPRSPIRVDGESIDSRFIDHYCYPFNFTGNPALVIPATIAADGLPIGVQLVGPRWSDERLLALGEVVSEIAGGIRTPPLE